MIKMNDFVFHLYFISNYLIIWVEDFYYNLLQVFFN